MADRPALESTADPHVDAPRLNDFPKWVYLLKEFQEVYTLGSPGGSKAIRAHRKKVRETLSHVINSNPEVDPASR